MWLVAGTAGTLISLVNLGDSMRDGDVLDELRLDPAIHAAHFEMIRLAAKARRDSHMTRLAICLLICATGVVGVMQPNPLRGGSTWTGAIVTVCLIAVAGLTAHRSYSELRQRGRMLELAKRRSTVIAAELRARNLTT